MLLLIKKRQRLINISQHHFSIFKSVREDLNKKFIYAGIINSLWQSWNSFWRSYWLGMIIGGINLNNQKINPCRPTFDESQAIYYLLFLLGKKKYELGKVRGSSEEVSWGSSPIILKLTSILNPINADLIFDNFSRLGLDIEHLQLFRNTLIHLDSSLMQRVRTSILPYYIINYDIKHPYEILESKSIVTNKNAMETWIIAMNSILLNM